ncbi:hypothetical protein BaRGS_00009976 [Batillaria attramentaria]|uniref:Uncharacterized protein n=1 Tax=Batillaria attramentaria TaxID=370345 RepID=A0ABD0LH19_9CAEN
MGGGGSSHCASDPPQRQAPLYRRVPRRYRQAQRVRCYLPYRKCSPFPNKHVFVGPQFHKHTARALKSVTNRCEFGIVKMQQFVLITSSCNLGGSHLTGW